MHESSLGERCAIVNVADDVAVAVICQEVAVVGLKDRVWATEYRIRFLFCHLMTVWIWVNH